MLFKTITSLLFSCLVVSFGQPVFDKKPATTNWVICESSSLVVNGSTNINKFSCAVASYPKPDTINVVQDKATKKICLTGSMNIAVAGFDCKNRIMTKELRKTLKEAQYPEIQISFISLNTLPNLGRNPTDLKGTVAIQIAGVKKRFEINYTMSLAENGEINLSAQRDVNFSDFNLTPPRKMGRLVQAKDKLSVALSLRMKVI
ncbi:MAG: YceI family protein [Bacteroidota bacterium]